MLSFDCQTEDPEARRAIALKPNLSTAHEYYGWYLETHKRLHDAIGQLKLAQGLDPLWIGAGDGNRTLRSD